MTYNTKSCKIIEIKKFTHNVKLIKIKSNLNPEPGQFIQVGILGIGECPLGPCSYNNQEIEMIIKNAGNVTSAIFKLKKGDSLDIRGPYGKGFPLEKIKGKDLIIIGGGTGIAPVSSLIDYIYKNDKNFGDIKIYFGFKDENNILIKNKFKPWKKKFNLTITLDEKLGIGNIKTKKGFIHEVIKNEKIKINSENTIAFICGPEIMMKNVSEELNNLGIKNNSIFWSMERRMECAFGNCGRCLIQDVYVCKDGPVFNYQEIKPKIENEQSSNNYI